MAAIERGPEFWEWYDGRCEAASRDEKFHILSPALSAAAIGHQIEQTGGFCMVLTVAHPEGTYTVTLSDDHADQFLIVWHPGDSWQTGDYSDEPTPEWTLPIEAVFDLLAVPYPGTE